jgi:colanic acid biosynthesis glycosyl transferase WcaI
VKILLYGLNFAPEPTGIGKYTGEMAAWLASRGHEVRVVTAPPYYPAWQVWHEYRSVVFRRREWAGVQIWRAPLWVPRNPGGLSRVLHLISFALASFPLVVRQVPWRPHVVVTIAPALTCAPGGWLVARLSGARAWLHLQDFEVDAAFKLGMLDGLALHRLARFLERVLLRRFDIVSSISERMLQRLRDKGVDPTRIRYFPNWVDTEAIRPPVRPSPYRAELGLDPETLVVLFSGTLGTKQGLLVIPEAAKRLEHRRDIAFIVCGDGPLQPRMEAAANAASNLRVLPLQPAERLSDLLGAADIHLLPQSPEAEDLVLPSKLTGMLASGRPVVATCRPGTEIAEIVSQCGEVVPPEDAGSLAASIVRLADDPIRRLELGRCARLIAERSLGRDSVLTRIAREMNLDRCTSAQTAAPNA